MINKKVIETEHHENNSKKNLCIIINTYYQK